MTKNEVLDIILENKIIAVIRMTDAAKLLRVVNALRDGGVRAVEITMTVPGALDVIRLLSSNKKKGDLVGAGTVLDGLTAENVIRAGADFVISRRPKSSLLGVRGLISSRSSRRLRSVPRISRISWGRSRRSG